MKLVRLKDSEAKYLGLELKKKPKGHGNPKYKLTEENFNKLCLIRNSDSKKESIRIRLNDYTARKIGLNINNSKRYRIKYNSEQYKKLNNLRMEKNIKRLFFDIETTPNKGFFWNAYPKYIPYDMVEETNKVICISYSWEGDDKIHRLEWENKHDKNTVKEITKNLLKCRTKDSKKLASEIIKKYLFDGCDKKLINRFVEVMKQADEIIAHNGDRFDIKILKTRAILHGVKMMPKYRTLDTLKKSRSNFKFYSNRLDVIAQELGVAPKVKHEGFPMWRKTMLGQKKATEEMGFYCDGDIVTLKDVYFVLQSYIKPNTHVGVINGNMKYSCPSCGNNHDITHLKNDVTEKGTISRVMECDSCGHNYNISNSSFRNYIENKKH